MATMRSGIVGARAIIKKPKPMMMVLPWARTRSDFCDESCRRWRSRYDIAGRNSNSEKRIRPERTEMSTVALAIEMPYRVEMYWSRVSRLRMSIWRKNAGRINSILTSEPRKESDEPMVWNIFLTRGSGFVEMVDDAEDSIPYSVAGAL